MRFVWYHPATNEIELKPYGIGKQPLLNALGAIIAMNDGWFYVGEFE